MSSTDCIELGYHRGYRLFARGNGRIRGYAIHPVAGGAAGGAFTESFQVIGQTIEEVERQLRAVIDEEEIARRWLEPDLPGAK